MSIENRIIELEIQIALQADLIDSLNNTVAKLSQTLELQQAQLRLLYQRLQDKNRIDNIERYSIAEEVPPHY